MRTSYKLALGFAVLIASIFLVRLNGWFGLGFAAVPFVILWWFDLGREMRNADPARRLVRIAGLLLGIPQAIFGLISFVTGTGVIAWVIYNSFWQRDPHYSGGFLALGIAPLLVLFGLGLLIGAFRRGARRDPRRQ